MKRKLFSKIALTIVTIFGVSLLAACGGSGAYDEYSRAYDLLQQAESFATSTRDFSRPIESATGEMTDLEAFTDNQVVKTETGYDGISTFISYGPDGSYSGVTYFRDGRSYSAMHEEDMAEDTRVSQACDHDFALQTATENLLDLPKELIVKQTARGIEEYRQLIFTLDPEKLFAWKFGEPDTGTRLTDFHEPPTFAVLLDKEGRLYHVRLNWIQVKPSRYERDIEVYFLQYGDMELDFPELNEEDYPDIDSLAN